jgi:hypothetical protein
VNVCQLPPDENAKEASPKASPKARFLPPPEGKRKEKEGERGGLEKQTGYIS